VLNLLNKVALVTGGAKRIGRAIALTLAERGCHVAIHFRQSALEAEDTAECVRSLGRKALTLKGELKDPDAAARIVDECVSGLGRLDVLINNASVFTKTSREKYEPKAWENTLAVNLLSPAAMSYAAARHMKTGGTIINLCDISAERPWPDYLAYCASKAGLIGLTRGLAALLAPSIRVNGVSPGVALWPDDFSDEQKEAILRRVPSHRSGSAEDVATAVRFLVEEGDYITGVILAVDGGRSIAW
jgi:pteridine reductase